MLLLEVLNKLKAADKRNVFGVLIIISLQLTLLVALLIVLDYNIEVKRTVDSIEYRQTAPNRGIRSK